MIKSRDVSNRKTYSFSSRFLIFGIGYGLLLIFFHSQKYVGNRKVLFFLGWMKHGASNSESLQRHRTPKLHSCVISSLNMYLYALGTGKSFSRYGVSYYFRSMSTDSIFQIPKVLFNRNSYFFDSKYNFVRSSLSI